MKQANYDARMAVRLPHQLNADQLGRLLTTARDAADNAKTPTKQLAAWRDFVMIQTGLLAGPRVAELCGLRVEDVDLGAGNLSIIRGKGDKDRRVKIGPKLATVLSAWIGTRTTGWLFPGPGGRQLSERTFQVRLDKLAKRAGIAQRVHPHILRHCFATALLKKGVNLRVIQRLLGHSSVAITEIYTFVDDDDAADAVGRL